MSKKKHIAALTGGLTAIVAAGTVAAGAAVPLPVLPGFDQDRSAELASQISTEKPRNVIIIIGDGMDDAIITAARNYEHGAGGRFEALDALPFTGAMTTYGLKAGEPGNYPIAYVSDSAPTASGWSTGKKTIDSRVSQGPSTALTVPGEDYTTVLEHFKAAGKLTGNVSTSELTDATPAAAASHINARSCQGPQDMGQCAEARKSAGGKGSIAEQLVDNEVDVLLGGGASRFAQNTDAGPSVLEYAQDTHDYRVVDDSAGLAGVTSLDDGPVLGLFATGNMTPHYAPLVAQAGGVGGPDTTCETADRGNQPDLATMTDKAIELLDNDKGFFLQVESAMVDKQEHASDICGAIGDVAELDKAVAVALEYQEENPDTLIVVTADHSHSTQIVGSASGGKATATLRTVEGSPMTVAYSTSNPGGSQGHTGSQVRVAASGPQAANVTGVIDQTDLFDTMMGRTPSTLSGATKPSTPVVAKPSVSIAGAARISRPALRRSGLRVAVAASGGNRAVVVKVVQGKRTLATRKVSAKGGPVKVRTGRAKPGKVRIVATVTGAGGTTTSTKTVRVTRR